MKKALKKKELKRLLIIAGIGIVLILIGILSWQFYFSKIYIFHEQENIFLDEVKKYYEINPRRLPKELETREITLQDLYDDGKLEALYVPKTDKMCDTNSWVRVYHNENGEYEYYVYLKCGKYESKVDNEGPEIELEGEESVIVNVGEEYSDPGVKRVYDKEDGEIDVSQVDIDSSKLDTSKVGSYKITYRASDKLKNETTVTRTVNVVAKLYSVARNNTDASTFYRGIDANNYVQFSGMLWRIVKVNEDNSVKVVLDSNAGNVIWGKDNTSYQDSNVYKWLNEYFYNHLTNPEKYIVQDASWCSSKIDNYDNIPTECNGTAVTAPVGLLTMYEFQNTMLNGSSYAKSTAWLLDTYAEDISWYVFSSGSEPLTMDFSTSILGVKPVINLKDSLYVVKGDGTAENPYKLNDYSYGEENDPINSRLDGEFFNYSGYVFRKAGEDKDGNVKMVMAGIMRESGTANPLKVAYTTQDKKFNVNEEGNVGYTLNNDILLYINDKYLVKHDFEVPIYQVGKNYDELEKYSINAYMSLPASYELFSTDSSFYLSNANYLLVDYVGENVMFINPGNSIPFIMDQSIFQDNGVKAAIYLKGDVKISSGNGTVNNPYFIK